MKIVSVVGARPNFMKIAPFIRAIEAYNENGQVRIEHVLVHTGQHYDDNMSRAFFEAVTDRLSDLLFTPDRLSGENLRQEGVAEDKIKFVGNIMIDTLEAQRGKAEGLEVGDVLRKNVLDSGRWSVDGGRWSVDGGRWSVGSGQWSAIYSIYRLPTTDYRPLKLTCRFKSMIVY
jgi:hypothetical protein